MSTATDPTLHEVSPAPERGERLKDVIGLLARLFLGAVLIYAGAVKVGGACPSAAARRDSCRTCR